MKGTRRPSNREAAMFFVSAAVCALPFLAGGIAARAQPPVEAPPVLSAKQFLTPQMLTGPLFQEAK